MKWNLYEGGCLFDTVVAPEEDIKALLADRLGEGEYDVEETIYVDGWAVPIRRGEEDFDNPVCATARIDPPAPKCVKGRGEVHEWEQTDVRGSGGGVLINEICKACGAAKYTDTWGQRLDTGEQGVEIISYREARR